MIDMLNVLPVILDQSDPIIIDMLKRIQEDPAAAAEICKEIAMRHKPLASQLKMYIRHELDRQESALKNQEATLIAEEMVSTDQKRTISYRREKRELTINGVTQIIPKATDAPKKEILLELVCEDYKGVNHGISTARYEEKMRAEGYELFGRSMETARTELNKEIRRVFGIKNLLHARNTKSMVTR